MRTSSLARVMASLCVSVVITLGCVPPPPAPTPAPTSTPFSVQSIFPAEGLIVGATVAMIAGTGFQPGDTVTVDGSRVDATVLSAYTISIKMPAHAAGNVDVTVISAINQARASVPGGYAYVVTTAPVISELLPNVGSTDSYIPVSIRGTGFRSGLTVSVDGIVSTDYYRVNSTTIQLYTRGHAAGPVEVIVTNPDRQAGSAVFTYASPATFDFNGHWQAWAQGPSPVGAILALTVRDNTVVSVSCSVCRNGTTCDSVPSPTLDPPPVVTDGAFSFAGSDGGSIDGKILSPNFLSGSINMASCVRSGQWTARKK